MLKRFLTLISIPSICMLAMPGFGADAGHLNPAVGRILERHGIVGNATLQRKARADEHLSVLAASSAAAPATFADAGGAPPHPDDIVPGPEVLGVLLRFVDDESKALSARNLSPPAAHLNEIAAVAPTLNFKRALAMGGFLFDFPEPVSWEVYLDLQAMLQDLDVVELVAPDTIAEMKIVPNDSFFYYQWNLLKTGDFSMSVGNTVVGINAIAAWDLVEETNPIVVAVLDTGYNLPLPVEESRMLPGYDFITELDRARDGDGRDDDPFDMGDWRKENECADKPDARLSTWHGQQMTSIIAAPGNDKTGIAGINWEAHILPVRVLGRCGGAVSDIVDGMLWSVGLPIPGVPQNQNPARILNMSLGIKGESGCNMWYQTAFRILKLTGVAVVASAGNDNLEAADHYPAGCDGPISAGAVDHTGERASYSNWSTRGGVDISAPGGDTRLGSKGRLVATSDSGAEQPENEVLIDWSGGTSAAAAHISGALSLAMRLDPLLHTDLLVAIMHETAQPFGPSSECQKEYPKCGVGILDLEALIQGALLFKDYAVVRDFYEPELQHYFRSGNWDEVSLVVSGAFGQWDEFDDMFLTWRDNKVIGTHPVCRFYGTPGIGPNSHFYTVDSNECEFIKQNDPGWTYEGVAFYAKKAYSTGGCPRATNPVYRYYNQKAHLNDSNHRYTTHLDDRSHMEALGWVLEGTAMCVPEL